MGLSSWQTGPALRLGSEPRIFRPCLLPPDELPAVGCPRSASWADSCAPFQIALPSEFLETVSLLCHIPVPPYERKISRGRAEEKAI